MKRVLSVMAMLFLVTKIYAQQDPQFSQNMFLTAPVNPGAAGIKGMHCVDLVARQQWTGFEGKPETGLLSYNAPISVFSNPSTTLGERDTAKFLVSSSTGICK